MLPARSNVIHLKNKERYVNVEAQRVLLSTGMQTGRMEVGLWHK